MNKEKNTANKISNLSEKPPITSPIFQDKLVSKVNELTFKNCISSIGHGASKTFNNEKGLTLNYKFVVDELSNSVPLFIGVEHLLVLVFRPRCFTR